MNTIFCDIRIRNEDEKRIFYMRRNLYSIKILKKYEYNDQNQKDERPFE